MQRTALVVKIKQAVMVIGVRICDGRIDWPVLVGRDGHSFIYIQCVLVHERDDTRHLCDHEQAKEAGTEAADRSNE